MHKRKKWITPMLFLLPSLCGISIFTLIPYCDVMKRSFSYNGHFSISNYIEVFHNKAFKLAASNTLKFIFVCIPLLLVMSLFLAVVLFKLGKVGEGVRLGLLLPMAFPVASFVVVWKALFDNQGFVNKILNTLEINGINWMDSRYAFWVLVVSYIWKNIGYSIVLWMAGLKGISTDIYEAARIDGADNRKCFWYITIPNLMPVLFTVTIIYILNSFKVYREAYLVAGDYPHESMYMMQHLLNNWFRDLALNKIAAASVINTIVLVLIVFLLQKSWKVEE